MLDFKGCETWGVISALFLFQTLRPFRAHLGLGKCTKKWRQFVTDEPRKGFYINSPWLAPKATTRGKMDDTKTWTPEGFNIIFIFHRKYIFHHKQHTIVLEILHILLSLPWICLLYWTPYGVRFNGLPFPPVAATRQPGAIYIKALPGFNIPILTDIISYPFSLQPNAWL